MNYIFDYQTFYEVAKYIRENYDAAYFLAFLITSRYPLEVSSLIPVKVKDIIGLDEIEIQTDHFEEPITIKLENRQLLPLSKDILKEVNYLIRLRGLKPDSNLFVTKRGSTIQLSSFSRMLSQTAKALDISELSCRSLRLLAECKPFDTDHESVSKVETTANENTSDSCQDTMRSSNLQNSSGCAPVGDVPLVQPSKQLSPDLDYLAKFSCQQLLLQLETLQSNYRNLESSFSNFLPYLSKEDATNMLNSLVSVMDSMQVSAKQLSLTISEKK